MIYSFSFFLILFILVGLASARYSQKTTSDYLLASENVKPWLAGFSFFATESSGFMFIGYIGLAYMIGMPALWILIGWYTGVVLILWRTARVMREHNNTVKAQTYGGLLSQWTGEEYKGVRILAALITIIFLSVYAAAQFTAGGKALNVLVGWNLNTGAIIGFVMVLLYCVAGGIRASIWTDSVQAIVMFLSLFLIAGYGVYEIGGLDALVAGVKDIDPVLMDITHGNYKYGLIGFIASWFFGGMGVLGQPHVMVRFMVLDKSENAKQALLYYAGLVTILSVLCMLSALCARVLFPGLAEADPELALPTMASQLMPGLLSGLFLAGLFAATMSTADSQVLSASGALTRDLVPKYKDSITWSKAGTVFVALIALGIAISGDKNVFRLALFGWSMMACGMGPLLFLYALGKRPSEVHALLTMFSGATVSLVWDLKGLGGDMFSVLPGAVCGLAVYFVLSLVMKERA